MRILYYSPHPQLKLGAPTGYGTHMREMVAAWRNMGIEVKTLIAGDLYSDLSYGVSENSPKRAIIKRVLPALVWQSLKDFRLLRLDRSLEKRLEDAIDDFKPDIIYERVAYLQNSGVRVAAKKGVKHISEINAPYPDERLSFSGKSWFISTSRAIEREILVRTNAVVVVSSALRDYFDKILPGVAAKTIVLPNSVNPEIPHISGEKELELKEHYGIQDQFVIGFVGSIFPYHGVDLLIEAFASLAPKLAIKLLIVGDGASLPELKAEARKRGVLQHTVFAGSVPHREVYGHIALMDICCMAKSNWYGSPVKIFEYGLMKKPVIAPNVSPIHDVMDETNAAIVDPDSKSIAKAIELLIDDADHRKQIAENWHRKVLEKYSWEMAAKKVLSLCE
jgi:glycosyltransferase involved in cell wall biosynthesis